MLNWTRQKLFAAILAVSLSPLALASVEANYSLCLLNEFEKDGLSSLETAQVVCKKEGRAVLRAYGKRSGKKVLENIHHQAESLTAAGQPLSPEKSSDTMEMVVDGT